VEGVEELDQLLVVDHLAIELDVGHLDMAGDSGAHLVVGGFLHGVRVGTHETHRGAENGPWEPLLEVSGEEFLSAPVAPCSKSGELLLSLRPVLPFLGVVLAGLGKPRLSLAPHSPEKVVHKAPDPERAHLLSLLGHQLLQLPLLLLEHVSLGEGDGSNLTGHEAVSIGLGGGWGCPEDRLVLFNLLHEPVLVLPDEAGSRELALDGLS